MSDDISLAFQLLFTGMLTVFIILTLVILLGRTLIILINRFEVNESLSGREKMMISKKKLAVLNAVVEVITRGKGVIHSVKKMD